MHIPALFVEKIFLSIEMIQLLCQKSIDYVSGTISELFCFIDLSFLITVLCYIDHSSLIAIPEVGL